MKFILFWILLLPFQVYPEPLYSEDQILEEAFVTFRNKNYFPLMEVLLDSVKAFSTRPIVVFGINATVPFSYEKYPFMIKRRIDVDNPNGVQFEKPRVLLESRILRGVYVDGDIILNDG